MDNILKIIRISSNKWFKILKKNSPYYCKSLNNTVNITRTFQNHISGYSKSRVNREIIERLSILNLIDDILLNWKIIEERKKWLFEWKEYKNTYKISFKIKSFYFILIIWEKYNWGFLLLSCFVKNIKTKKD